MKHHLNILQSNIRLSIQETIVDYRVNHDITGKVYEVKPLVFELPKIAQQLILGKKPEEMVSKIDALGNLIQLMLPFGIVEQVPFLHEELKEIIANIDRELKVQRINKEELFLIAEKESLESYILYSFMDPVHFSSTFEEVWKKAVKLLKNRDKQIDSKDIGSLMNTYPQFGYKILLLFIPYTDHKETKAAIYKELKYFVDDRCTAYLLNELANTKDEKLCNGILQGLAGQNIQELYIQDIIIDFFYSDIRQEDKTNIYVMEVLKKIPNKKTFAVGKEIVKLGKNHSISVAARILIEIGYPPKHIADFMLSKLQTSTPSDSKLAFSVFRNSDELLIYLPKLEVLLEIFVKILEKGWAYNLSSDMAEIIIKKRNDFWITSKIINYLDHEDPNVRRGLIELIGKLLHEHGIYNRPFTSKSAELKYFKILKDKDDNIANELVCIISMIGIKKKRTDYIYKLLDVIDFSRKSYTTLWAMRGINILLEYLPYDNQITTIYLRALELKDNFNYRKEALVGLRHSRDTKLKQTLSYLKDDPSKEVREVAEQLFDSPRKSSIPNIFIRAIRYLYVECKYNGRPPSRNEKLNEETQESENKQHAKRIHNVKKYALKI